MMRLCFAALCLAAAMTLGCAGTAATPAPAATDTESFEVTGPRSFGAADNVMTVKHLHISRQPDKKGLEKAAKAGIDIVIDTRVPGELRWNEKAAVEAAGMSYYNVPIARRGDSFDDEALATITELVQRHPDQQILLHCGSGNRVSAWLATHLVEDHDLTLDEALGIARQTGLTSPALESRVEKYLSDKP